MQLEQQQQLWQRQQQQQQLWQRQQQQQQQQQQAVAENTVLFANNTAERKTCKHESEHTRATLHWNFVV